MKSTRKAFGLGLIFIIVIFGGYGFLVVNYKHHYESRDMPKYLNEFTNTGGRLASFYKKNGRFPAHLGELDVETLALVNDKSSGISIDFGSNRIRYNFEDGNFDLYGSPLHVLSLGLVPANRNFALEYDIITIQNMANK